MTPDLSNDPLRSKAQAVAEKIWVQITKQMKFIAIITPETPRHLQDWIAQALVEFAEEYKNESCVCTAEVQSSAISKAVAEERERCARVAESFYVMKGSENDGMAFVPEIAERIREGVHPRKGDGE